MEASGSKGERRKGLASWRFFLTYHKSHLQISEEVKVKIYAFFYLIKSSILLSREADRSHFHPNMQLVC